MSSNGRCCSIVWPEARQYVIFAQGAQDEWRQVDGDSGVAVAWAGGSSTYAVLYQPQAGLLSTAPPHGLSSLLCMVQV